MFYGRVICPFVRSAQVRLFLYCSDDIESVSPSNVHQRYEILIVWSVFLICVKKKELRIWMYQNVFITWIIIFCHHNLNHLRYLTRFSLNTLTPSVFCFGCFLLQAHLESIIIINVYKCFSPKLTCWDDYWQVNSPCSALHLYIWLLTCTYWQSLCSFSDWKR